MIPVADRSNMRNPNDDQQNVDRRSFLRRSLIAGVVTASSAIKLPTFARVLSTDSPIASTSSGKVRGYLDNGINVFKGIRYGADTTNRRFMPPAPPAPWFDVRDALAYGPSAPQPSRATDKPNEDCLFLNVWTPGLRDGRKRPVMFYIHGGAYNNGSGSTPLYDGVRLCRRGDVVVVSINHRLNAFGYLYLAPFGGPELADSGNAGQLDLILALQWARANIGEFGGDPNRIMVFGQSGGGAKIATLMAMPLAKGLFHRAATMSGQQVTASGPLNATLRTRTVLEALKLSPQRAAELRTIPADKLLEAINARDPVLPFGGVSFAPVLDERSLQRHPFYPDAPSQSAHVPMIIGNTHDETRAFLGGDENNF
ncbi:MAG TPA: carboxylesterase family protein, partial [Pyrinomonadaceae bacterium]